MFGNNSQVVSTVKHYSLVVKERITSLYKKCTPERVRKLHSNDNRQFDYANVTAP